MTPVATAEVARAGCVVLAETPPAPDLDSLHALWEEVGATGRVHVAEQYLSLPMHAARLAVVRARARRRAAVRPRVLDARLPRRRDDPRAARRGRRPRPRHRPCAPLRRTNRPAAHPRRLERRDDSVHDAGTVLATLDLDGRHGLYDFTDNQWHNQLRSRRILVRGTHGEISNDDVLRLSGPRQVTTTTLRRRQLGYDLDLDGYDTDHVSLGGEVLWSNPFIEESASWTRRSRSRPSCSARPTSRATRGRGPTRSHGRADHAVSLAIDEAVETDRPVTVARQALVLTTSRRSCPTRPAASHGLTGSPRIGWEEPVNPSRRTATGQSAGVVGLARLWGAQGGRSP